MKKVTIAIIVFALTCLLIASYAHAAEPSEPHNTEAMWIEPSTIDLAGASIGYRFNVTVWLNLSVSCAGWQFKVLYTNATLNATKAGYTAGAKSDFLQSQTTMPVSPTFEPENATHHYVLHGEVVLFSPYRDPGYGSLAWVEFEVIAAGPYSLILDISANHHPPDSKTYALTVVDEEIEEIPLNVFDANVIPEFSSWLLIAFLSLASFIILVGAKRRK